MSEAENTFVILWENVERRYNEQLREAFKKRAGKDNQVNSGEISDLLNDFGVILAYDCDEAKNFFSKENSDLPKKHDLNAMKYESFIEIFGLWLQTKARAEGKTVPEIDLHEKASSLGKSNPPHENASSLGKSNPPHENAASLIKSNLSHDKAASLNKLNPPKATKPSPNYEQDKKLMDDLFSNHKEDYQAIFKDRLFEENQTEIAIQDYFIFLSDCFELDQVELKENAESKEDFFRSINSYKRLFKVVETYITEENPLRPHNPEKQITLSFDECFKVLDHWLKTDADIMLVDKREKEETKVGSAKRTLLVTIANYEKLIKDTNNEIEKQILQATVDSLKEKLIDLEKGLSKEGPKSIKSVKSQPIDPRELQQRKDEKRQRALREIFFFYCTQQYNNGRAATFEKLDRLASTITIGTFRVFLKNFRLKMDNRKLVELYNKSAGSDENINFDEFCDLLNKVALRVEIAPEPKVHQPKPEIMKDYKPTSYKEDPSYKIFKQNEPKRIEEVLTLKRGRTDYFDEVKRDNERLEEIWEHMGLYNDSYKNLTGWVHLPFNSQEKQNFRMPLEFNYRPKGFEGKSPVEVQEDVQKRNDQRKFVKDLQTFENNLLGHYRGSSSPIRGTLPTNPKDETYLHIQSNKSKMSIPVPKKLTMKKIEKYQQGEFVRFEEKFNPHDLIDDNDDEDNLYLAEYKIHAEKKERKTPVEVQKRKLEEYGKLKKAARGFAVNGKYGSGSQSPRHSDSKQYVSASELPGYDSRQRSNHSPVPQSVSPTKGVYSSPKNGRGVPLMSMPSYLDYESTSNSHPRSVKHSYINRGDNTSPSGNHGYYDNSYTKKSSNNYNSTLDRASQIEADSRKREQQMIHNIMNIQNGQVRRGLKAVGK